MAESKFLSDEDNSDEELYEFEPLRFDTRIFNSETKEYVKQILEQNGNVTTDDLKHRLKNLNLLPDSFFGEAALNEVDADGREKADAILQNVPGVNNLVFADKNALPVLIKQEIDGEEKEWSLTGTPVWYIKEDNPKSISTVEINKGGNCLNGYVTVLALLASVKDAPTVTESYRVSMHVVTMKSASHPVDTTELELSPQEACRILQNIYEAMFVEKYQVCVPYKLLKEGIDTDKGFSDFKYKLTTRNGGPWSYFSKKDMFDLDKDIGYTEAGFLTEWDEACDHQRQFIVYLN